MNREVVKTDCATTRIPELDFEIPAFTQKGCEYYCTNDQGRTPLTVNGFAVQFALGHNLKHILVYISGLFTSIFQHCPPLRDSLTGQ